MEDFRLTVCFTGHGLGLSAIRSVLGRRKRRNALGVCGASQKFGARWECLEEDQRTPNYPKPRLRA